MGDIDKQIAEKVMGWSVVEVPDDGSYIIKENNFRYPQYPFDPSTNISRAWLVVEKMRELGYSINIEAQQKGKWRCNIILIGNEWTTRIETADEDTAPMAICLAALQALEVKGE